MQADSVQRMPTAWARARQLEASHAEWEALVEIGDQNETEILHPVGEDNILRGT